MKLEQQPSGALVAEVMCSSSEVDRRPTVAHLTSSHAAYDNRILDKECGTLAAAGYDVVLVAPAFHLRSAHGVTPRPAPGVRIVFETTARV